MFVKETVVGNQVGLHARPATFFTQKANEFNCSIWIEKEERKVNAKSLLGVLSLGVVQGTKINIIADGVDEEAAVDTLCKLIHKVQRDRVFFVDENVRLIYYNDYLSVCLMQNVVIAVFDDLVVQVFQY